MSHTMPRYAIERLDNHWRVMDTNADERVYFAPYYEGWERSAELLHAVLYAMDRRLAVLEAGMKRLTKA